MGNVFELGDMWKTRYGWRVKELNGIKTYKLKINAEKAQANLKPMIRKAQFGISF